jgi:hypothetical protein
MKLSQIDNLLVPMFKVQSISTKMNAVFSLTGASRAKTEPKTIEVATSVNKRDPLLKELINLLDAKDSYQPIYFRLGFKDIEGYVKIADGNIDIGSSSLATVNYKLEFVTDSTQGFTIDGLIGENEEYLHKPSFSNDDLLVYWPMQEGTSSSVADYSGNSFSGTNVNSGWSTASPKESMGNCFEGSATANDGIYSSGSTSFQLSQGTISLWFNPDIVSGSHPDYQQGLCSVYDGGNYGFSVYLYNNYIIVFNYPTAGYYFQYVLAITESDFVGVDTHLVITHDGNKIELYLNGVRQTAAYNYAGTPDTFLENYSNPAVHVGRIHVGGTMQGEFDGTIDEFRLYSRALSASEVWTLYTQEPFFDRIQKYNGCTPYTGTTADVTPELTNYFSNGLSLKLSGDGYRFTFGEYWWRNLVWDHHIKPVTTDDFSIVAEHRGCYSNTYMTIVPASSGNGTVSIYSIKDGSTGVLLYTTRYPITTDNWYHIQVVISSGYHAFLINNDLIYQWYDDAIPSGMLGWVLPPNLYIDNLQVRLLAPQVTATNQTTPYREPESVVESAVGEIAYLGAADYRAPCPSGIPRDAWFWCDFNNRQLFNKAKASVVMLADGGFMLTEGVIGDALELDYTNQLTIDPSNSETTRSVFIRFKLSDTSATTEQPLFSADSGSGVVRHISVIKDSGDTKYRLMVSDDAHGGDYFSAPLLYPNVFYDLWATRYYDSDSPLIHYIIWLNGQPVMYVDDNPSGDKTVTTTVVIGDVDDRTSASPTIWVDELYFSSSYLVPPPQAPPASMLNIYSRSPFPREEQLQLFSALEFESEGITNDIYTMSYCRHQQKWSYSGAGRTPANFSATGYADSCLLLTSGSYLTTALVTNRSYFPINSDWTIGIAVMLEDSLPTADRYYPIVTFGQISDAIQVMLWARKIDASTWRFIGRYYNSNASSFTVESTTMSATSTRSKDGWYKVFLTYSHGHKRLRIYVNGELQNTTKATAAMTTNTALTWASTSWVLGYTGSDYTDTIDMTSKQAGVDMYLSDFLVWDAELSANEIKRMWDYKDYHKVYYQNKPFDRPWRIDNGLVRLAAGPSPLPINTVSYGTITNYNRRDHAVSYRFFKDPHDYPYTGWLQLSDKTNNILLTDNNDRYYVLQGPQSIVNTGKAIHFTTSNYSDINSFMDHDNAQWTVDKYSLSAKTGLSFMVTLIAGVPAVRLLANMNDNIQVPIYYEFPTYSDGWRLFGINEVDQLLTVTGYDTDPSSDLDMFRKLAINCSSLYTFPNTSFSFIDCAYNDNYQLKLAAVHDGSYLANSWYLPVAYYPANNQLLLAGFGRSASVLSRDIQTSAQFSLGGTAGTTTYDSRSCVLLDASGEYVHVDVTIPLNRRGMYKAIILWQTPTSGTTIRCTALAGGLSGDKVNETDANFDITTTTTDTWLKSYMDIVVNSYNVDDTNSLKIRVDWTNNSAYISDIVVVPVTDGYVLPFDLYQLLRRTPL